MALDQPEINATELTAEMRKSMARQVLKSHAPAANAAQLEHTSHPVSTPSAVEDISPPALPLSPDLNTAGISGLSKSAKLELQPVFEPNSDDQYDLNDLLKFHDASFLNAAYRAVLKREPDSFGYNYYLEQLRAGHIDKVDVLAILRLSSEGKLKNVRVTGLALPTFLRRLGHLPIIGYPVRLGIGILRLPSLIHRVRRQEAYSSGQDHNLAEHLNKVAEHVNTLTDALKESVGRWSATTTDLLRRADMHDHRHDQAQQRIVTLVEQQRQIAAELRQELIASINNERAATQQLIQQSIQEQQSLLESSNADTRDRIAQLDASVQTRIAQLNTAAEVRIAQLENAAEVRIAQLESSVREEIARLEVATNDVRTKITAAESATTDLRAWISTVESSSNDLRSTTNDLQSSANTAQTEIEKVYQQLQHARTELAVQGRRMALILDEARRRLPAPFDQAQLETIATEEQHNLDALYAELEDNFRGSYDEIKHRFLTYLPLIQSSVIANSLPILDLGCGRGEWLELLKEAGYGAIGLDTNRVLLDRCRARGLEVVETDVLKYLRSRPDNSLSAITGFHIIEHLEIAILMQLLDEVVRVVHPGGVVIFETPNPENVLVGSNYFYFDPTHRNPLPSLLMKFLLETRGLQRVEVMNLHAWDQARLEGKNAVTARFNELFYGPMDYAIAGWKVSA